MGRENQRGRERARRNRGRLRGRERERESLMKREIEGIILWIVCGNFVASGEAIQVLIHFGLLTLGQLNILLS
jgi:hypothetical protein